MRVVETVDLFTKELESARLSGRRVGLVPTMGALHRGHLSLVERARAETGLVALTIFVNPLQFDEPGDLAAYPKDLDADLDKARSAGVDLAFVPPVAEMYPPGSSTTVSVGSLSRVLEGAERPGHLDGVATVVCKLFAMAAPCRAYFGEKDFQQLAAVRRLASDLCLPVEVVGCPTVRDGDGLACSSRNARLSEEEREAALVLHKSLVAGRDLVTRGERRTDAVEGAMREIVASEPLVSLSYAVAVDPTSIERPEKIEGDVRLLVAVRVGPVRLIDNLEARAGCER